MLNSVLAIVGTIIISLATNLLTPYVAKFLETISSKAKERSKQKKLIFENTVKYILENPLEEIVLRIRYFQQTIMSFFAIGLGFVLMITNNGFLIILGILFSAVGYYGNSKAEKFSKILQAVTKNKKISHPDIDLV